MLKMPGLDNPEMWDSIRETLSGEGVLIQVLMTNLQEQIEKSSDSNQLFRENNGLTHLMGSFLKKELKNLGVVLVVPILREIENLNFTLEIDPTKVNFHESVKSVQALQRILGEYVFDRLNSFEDEFTPNVKFIFQFIKTEVEKKYKGCGFITVGGFLFLRFITPILVMPKRFLSNVTEPSQASRRSLMLVAKVMQAIANQSIEPFNELCMTAFNDYVVSQYVSVNVFLDHISSIEEMPTTETTVSESHVYNTVEMVLNGIVNLMPLYKMEFFKLLEQQRGMAYQFIHVVENVQRK
ncbi:hypothetical protein EIN_387000 [Entamoeba invadens IP1]|uniref:Ras-GAP domain-containing protein n=1 Tax=Entamoeba invadens IP1 TaxID=370355 RepID=A0A0A1UDY1_ENTIV|nr:hypothetical protein EIN_387000 [Entamoeba invadens IP1]ELP91996.1 hypothetical protein EIN_387000 [Entamoeba invadens IP1]|eukprot:XP_004258767.1 hypothetical protein EIN_387000 [Entamoeba invadens IP1]